MQREIVKIERGQMGMSKYEWHEVETYCVNF